MKHGLLYAVGFLTAALLALSAKPAMADAVGPYYATPSWDQTLPASTRFVVLSNFNSQAVLDRETGLVWQRSPTNFNLQFFDASSYCLEAVTGGRLGWRLPTVDEIHTLFDPAASLANPPLPPGHPFTGVPTPVNEGEFVPFWSATEVSGAPQDHYTFGYQLTGGEIQFFPRAADLSDLDRVWRVRGGHYSGPM